MKPRLVKLRKSALATLIAVPVLIALGCGESSGPMQGGLRKTETSASPQRSIAGAPADVALASAPALQGRVSGASTADQVANASSAALVAPTMVIRNGSASLEVDSIELAIAAVQKLAASLGGYVGNTSMSSGALSVRSAELEIKIPAARYNDALSGLPPIGKVESQNSTAEDVGEEFVDVTARQTNAHRLEERLIALLATRTGKLEDVLAVERELARVREEIERYEGRLRYLKTNVATSTISITVHEKQPVVTGYEGQNVIVESFKNAWRIFVRFVAVLISSLGWIIPVGIIATGVVYVGRKYTSRSPIRPAPVRKAEGESPLP